MTQHLRGARAVTWQGVTYRTVLSTAATNGALSITDSVSPPNSGPPRHIHHREDEAFVILSGCCEFWVGGQRRICGPEDSAFVPRGTEHTFRVVGDLPCRHLVILTPGGFEGFFADMARDALKIPQDMDRVIEVARTYALEFTGPPLGPE